MNVIEARDQLTELLKRVADGERIILKKCGKKVAALVPVADAERLEQLEDESDIRAARKALKQYKESGGKGTVTLEEVKKRLGMS